MSSWQVLHSLLYFVSFPSGSFSCNISFLLAFISIKFSFLYDSYFILSLFCLISLWQLFHAIFHSFWHSFQSNFHFFMAATSFSLGFCLIPLWQLFHAIFHSFWHFFQSYFHFFRVVTSFSLAFRVHPMGHQESGHMTSCLKG